MTHSNVGAASILIGIHNLKENTIETDFRLMKLFQKYCISRILIAITKISFIVKSK